MDTWRHLRRASAIYRQVPLVRARIRKTMTSTTHSPATAAGVNTALPADARAQSVTYGHAAKADGGEGLVP
jgi:hypothetical protein